MPRGRFSFDIHQRVWHARGFERACPPYAIDVRMPGAAARGTYGSPGTPSLQALRSSAPTPPAPSPTCAPREPSLSWHRTRKDPSPACLAPVGTHQEWSHQRRKAATRVEGPAAGEVLLPGIAGCRRNSGKRSSRDRKDSVPLPDAQRQQNLQPLAWFWDLHNRARLDLDPPYQRRSVWNQAYKDHFIDTVLLNLPAPAVFLYEELDPSGIAKYSVVDGKQRLTTVFEFVQNFFPVADSAEASAFRGKYFKDFEDKDKRTFWSYRFLVEYLPSRDDTFINDVFNRINKNVSKLTPQELRHAKFSGAFADAAEKLAEWMSEVLPSKFPRITTSSRAQMKDVEVVSQLLLYLENGVSSFSQQDLDVAYADRDADWPAFTMVDKRFRETIQFINAVVTDAELGAELLASRLQNQADFYSFFAASAELASGGHLPPPAEAARRLYDFLDMVSAAPKQEPFSQAARQYFEDARSASNDKGPRTRRIETIRRVLIDDMQGNE